MYLHDNVLQIGAKGAEFIADTLKYNKTISVLDLRANGLKDEVSFCRYQCLLVQDATFWLLNLMLFFSFSLYAGCSLPSSQLESG
jgi:hypothetical protein